jgi:ribosome-dependent ATPase
MEDAIADAAPAGKGEEDKSVEEPVTEAQEPTSHGHGLSPMKLRVTRMLAYARNETLQILRDPVRLMFAFAGSALLMLVFGFGITTDVEHIRYASLDLDRSPESRLYLEQFAGSQRYFSWTPPAQSAAEALKRLQADDVSVVLEIPPQFGRDFRRGSGPEVLAQVDGAMTFRGDTVEQYVQGVHATALSDPATGLQTAAPKKYAADIEERFMYNPTFESVYSMVPSMPALLLLSSRRSMVSIVREGARPMDQLYIDAHGKLEYCSVSSRIVIGMINFLILTILALVVFAVPIRAAS